MSLDFTLTGTFDHSPEDAVGQLLASADLKRTSPTTAARHGMFVSAVVAEEEEDESLFVSGFGFHPKLDIRFELQGSPDMDFEHNLQLMLRGVVALLRDTSDDAVLLFNDEEIVVQRLRGRLTTNSADTDIRTFNLLDELNTIGPYDERPLKSPLT